MAMNGIGNSSFKQKFWISEAVYLVLLVVLIPFLVGLQIWDSFAFILSLVFLNILMAPSIILFYRFYLPKTLLNGKWLIFILLFPIYLLIYELNTRAVSVLLINLNFIPKGYRDNLASAAPGDFSQHILVQNIGYTLLILTTASSLAFVRQLFIAQSRLDKVETAKLKLELDQLKNQLQPHFFFNTLNNLYSLSVQGSKQTSAMIASLSSIMRYVLYESNADKVPLVKELQFLQDYIALERIRHTDEGVISFNVQGRPEKVMIAPLLFLPLIENCFKHALQTDLVDNSIRIDLIVDQDELVLQTENKMAKNLKAAEVSTGEIGLNNIRKRLNLLYPGKHELVTVQEDDVFIVTLTLQNVDHD